MLRKQYSLFSFLLFIFSLSCSSSVPADQFSQILINDTSNLIGKQIAFLDEKIGSQQALTLEQARQAYRQGNFSHSKQTVLSFGIGVSPKWLVAEIKNPENHRITRRFIIENSWLDKADIYILHNEQLLQQMHLGDSYPFYSRIIPHRFFAFDHDYDPGVTQIFIRVETPDPMMFPIFSAVWMIQLNEICLMAIVMVCCTASLRHYYFTISFSIYSFD